ncbi:MAG: TonB family protein [Bacteroidota bacterium]
MGNQYFSQKDYRKAIEYYSKSLKLYPAADAYFNRALSYIRIKDTCNYCDDLDAAIRYFNDKEAGVFFYKTCAKRDTIVENSDSISKEFPEYSYTVITIHNYDSGSFKNYFDRHNNRIQSKCDQLPEFPGGEIAIKQFFAENIKYPLFAWDAKIEGTIIARFFVDSDGSLSDIKLTNGIGGGCDEEYIRVLRLMPRWKPGTRKDVPVEVQTTLPVKFTLADYTKTGNNIINNTQYALASEYDNNMKGTIVYNPLEKGKVNIAESSYKKGTKALKSKEYEKAISLFTYSISKFPLADAYYNRSAAYYFLGDTCRFCLDLKNAVGLGDGEAIKLYKEKCIYSTIDNNLPDSVKLRVPTATHLEIQHELFGKDSTIYVISNRNGRSEEIDISDIYTYDAFVIVEEMPSFPGGGEALIRYISENLHYTDDARKNHIQGTVYVLFVVEKDGSIRNAKVLKGIGGSCDKEAIRLVLHMPKWNPGKQGGEPVRVRYNMPVSFPLVD